MKTPEHADVEACLSAIKQLLDECGIQLNLIGIFRTGGPTSPVGNVARLRGGHPNLQDPDAPTE
ncbi:hypothetical protein [Pseudorhodoferax aquiterrae]|uniref:hypothetical protein n=1 Tax=Pseudorhodoferax aquiterrae TaxID=747304 RepID=UPI001678D480|nr:hypothetical protein [Pseudorhodoferax aquiterrae]